MGKKFHLFRFKTDLVPYSTRSNGHVYKNTITYYFYRYAFNNVLIIVCVDLVDRDGKNNQQSGTRLFLISGKTQGKTERSRRTISKRGFFFFQSFVGFSRLQ